MGRLVGFRKDQPAPQDVHVDEVLSNFGVAFMQSQDMYISTKVFPIVEVDKQSNKYPVFTKNDWFRDEAQKRADNTESAGSGYTWSTDSYFAEVWAFHKDVGSQARANSDAWINLDRGASQFVTQRLLLRREIQWVTDFFTTGIWGTDTTVAVTWDDYTGSDPLEDIENAKETMLSTTGFMPNTLTVGYQVWRRLKNHPDLVDRFKHTTSAALTPAMVASILELDNIYIAKAIKATNVEGETAAYSFTHGKHGLLTFVNPNAAAFEPSAGYTFAWTRGIGSQLAIDSFEIRKTKTTRYEGEMAFDNKVVAPELGIFLPNVVA